MDKISEVIFRQLFKETYKKCFNHTLSRPMSETESKLMCVDIQEKTGLVLGFKSVKNYSISVAGEKDGKEVNPSLATLDTLARYVLKAPVTTELERNRNESHYPYWHLYKKHKRTSGLRTRRFVIPILLVGIAVVSYGIFWSGLLSKDGVVFYDDFSDVDRLESKSWLLVGANDDYWARRGEEQGLLKLFTLEGDNWPDSSSATQRIQNLLMQPIDAGCFNAEAQIVGFFPKERWQQAGIIILEDPLFTGNMLRLSVAYNDFFGGFDFLPEVIVQGITSQGTNNPEEFLHHRIFQLDSISDALIERNLLFSRLRVERRGDEFRFLFGGGSLQNSAYKEIGRHEFSMNPRYIGIFALKGNVKETEVVPVNFDFFKLETFPCKN